MRSCVIEMLPESQAALPSERQAADKAAVISMLDKAGVECEPVVYRMGRPRASANGSSHPRPVKVVLPSSNHQRAFLSSSRSVRERFHAFLRPSLTAAEREAEYNLRQERRRRVAAGEVVSIFDGKIV